MVEKVIRIAVDAMGGDNVPDVLVEGSLDALLKYSDIEITLVGDENSVGKSVKSFLNSESFEKSGASLKESVEGRITIVHADDVIEMCDSPARAIRSKKVLP